MSQNIQKKGLKAYANREESGETEDFAQAIDRHRKNLRQTPGEVLVQSTHERAD